MKLIIDIPEDMFEWFKNGEIIDEYDKSALKQVFKNGIPLPKGHGRLIDADRLRSMYSINRANFNTVVGIQKWIDNAPTIIESDKESEET